MNGPPHAIDCDARLLSALDYVIDEGRRDAAPSTNLTCWRSKSARLQPIYGMSRVRPVADLSVRSAATSDLRVVRP